MTLQIQADHDHLSGNDDRSLDELTPHAEGYRSLLKNSNFLALWIGQIFSQLGDRVVFVVFIAMIVRYFGVSDRYTSFLYIAFTIPAIVLTSIAGVFIDRWPRRAVLVITNVLRAVLVAFLPLAASHGLLSIYALAFLLSGATQFFVPAEAATIPMIVRKPQLIAANSLFTTTMMSSVIFGFALGDPLINIFSLEGVHWAIVGLFFLASFCLLFVKAPSTPPLEAGRLQSTTIAAAYGNFLAEMKDGICYIMGDRLMLKAMFKLAFLFSIVVALCILCISFAKEYLYDNPLVAARKFAYLVAVSGLGMAIGAFLVGRFFRKASRSRMVFSGYAVMGTSLLFLAFIGSIAKTNQVFSIPPLHFGWMYLDAVHYTFRMLYAYIFVFLLGCGAAFIAIPLQSLLHEIIPEDKRGKILGVQFTLLSTCSTLPVLAVGLGVEQIGTKWMFVMIGIPTLLIGIYGLYRRLIIPHAVTTDW